MITKTVASARFACLFAGLLLLSGVQISSVASENVSAGGRMIALNSPVESSKPAALKPFSVTQKKYFERNWGVEVIGIHPVSSGYMLNFRYRIVDPEKAKPLNDMKSRAYVVDNATGTRLAVPALENIGELRSGTTPKADRIYFMIFGNPGRLVKAGSSVGVVIGNFHVDNLIVN